MKILLLIMLSTLFISCATTIQTVSTPPPSYVPTRVTTDKELIKEYESISIRVFLWEAWAEINELEGYTNEK